MKQKSKNKAENDTKKTYKDNLLFLLGITKSEH